MSAIIESNPKIHVPICNNCTHYLQGLRCVAFEIIPDEILLGFNDHRKPLPDQPNDIVFEPKEKRKVFLINE